MKLSQFLIRDAIERSALKLAVIALSLMSLLFASLLVVDLSRAPILVERACESRLLATSGSSQTKEEIQAFIGEATKARFDTFPATDPLGYLSTDLISLRIKEQEDLKGRNIDQRIFVRSIKSEGDLYLVEADRLVAVGKVRSALPIRLTTRISSRNRSTSNPYGLVLTSMEQIKEPNDD